MEHIKNHMVDRHGKRDFTSKTPGTRLCGDIPYLRTGSGRSFTATEALNTPLGSSRSGALRTG